MGKEYREIEKIRFTFLESNEALDKSIIKKIYPRILVILDKILHSYHKNPKLRFVSVEILEIKTAKYEFAPVAETFAKIVIRANFKKTEKEECKKETEKEECKKETEKEKIKKIEFESYMGRAVGFCDNKKIEILFKDGFIEADFSLTNPIPKDGEGERIDEKGQKDGIKDLLVVIEKDLLDIMKESEEDFHKRISAGNSTCLNVEIDKITRNIIKKARGPKEYEKFSSLNEILRKFEIPDERYKASIKVLLDQYNDLRSEITQSIYLEQAAIIVLYTFLGVAVAYLLEGGITGGPDFSTLLSETDLRKIIPFLVALNFAQVIICGLGSLFLREQARNRRACSFQKAIEYIINQKIGKTGIYWENYITSSLIEKEIGFWNYFKTNIPINREYYKNRLLGIGLPIVLPNFLVLTGILYMAFDSVGKITPVFPISSVYISLVCIVFASVGKIALVYYISSIISGLIAYWACTIARKSCFPLKEEIVPSREEVLEWIEKENRKFL